jgi:acyl-CoA reductase-like NAD-dependent aldehyde dehydrogenase
LAGNAILIKPSPQTPSSSERIVRLLTASGLPDGVAQVLHMTPQQVDKVLVDKRIPFISFTGSVANGLRVEEMSQALAAGRGFKRVNLELGGKDAAYVREDADMCAQDFRDAAA